MISWLECSATGSVSGAFLPESNSASGRLGNPMTAGRISQEEIVKISSGSERGISPGSHKDSTS